MKITDGKKTVDIELTTWTGTSYSPFWTADFLNAGSLPYDNETDTYAVYDVDYCINQAMDWKHSRGDFGDDEPNKNNEVFVAEIETEPRMTIKELALNLIQHAEETPEPINLDRATEIISWLDHDSNLPLYLTPEAFMEAFNSILRSSYENEGR